MEQVQTNNTQIEAKIDEKLLKFCQSCHSGEKQLLRCARCKKVYYCNAQCQKKHWPTHKINCSKAKQNCNPESDKKITQPPKQVQKQPDTENPFPGLQQFGPLTHIGSGNFSQIYKATSKKDGQTYAIKQVQKAKVSRIRKQADLFMQKHCLSKLKPCPYAINLYRTFQDQLNLFIQMQCPSNGQLWQQCRTFGFFSQELFKFYTIQLVKALSIIHNEYEIVHRDLKPENILLNEKYEIKLIDFGTAKDLSRPDIKGAGNGLKGKKQFQHYVGTPNYMAPECIHNKQSEKKCDVYSLSGVMYFMKVGAPPFTGGSEFIVFKKSLENQMFLCDEFFSAELKDLLLNMNKKNVEQRFDINQVKNHAYFKGVDWDNLPIYEQVRSKCSPLQLFLQQQSRNIFNKYHKTALQGKNQVNKQIYQSQILPFLTSLPQNLPFQLSSQQQKKTFLIRVQMMKIQCQVMMNYFDDNSVGFVEVYTKDFDGAERLINQVRYGKGGKKQKQQENKDNKDNKEKQQGDKIEENDDEDEKVNMKKNKNKVDEGQVSQ